MAIPTATHSLACERRRVRDACSPADDRLPVSFTFSRAPSASGANSLGNTTARSAELAVQQGDQAPLRRQFTRELVGPILLNNLLQLRPRHVLRQTVKYAILMQHGVGSFS